MARKILIWISLLLVLLPWTSGRAQQNQDPLTFSVSVNLVKVPVSLFDEMGAPELRLHAGDFRVFHGSVFASI